MQTTTVQTILDKNADTTLGHLIYVVRDGALVFYVGQSKRDVVERFFEHLQKPSRLGQLISLNRPQSLKWQVDFYTMADCRPYVNQKSLFAMQEWENFDMNMAEQSMIREFRPVLNRDFNGNPTPLPSTYQGHHLTANRQTDIQAPEYRVWLNRMGLQGWTYEEDEHGRLIWHHRDGRTLPDEIMATYRDKMEIPKS